MVLGSYNPSGHLPFTWYQNASDLPALDDYSIPPSANRYEVYDGRYGLEIANSASDSDVLARQEVTVGGRLNPVPSVLTAKPTMLGDAARGIQSRVTYPEDATVTPHLTLSMNDESLYGFIEPGKSKPFPAGARFAFSSDHPDVVAVERGNTIRTLRNGVATITATVTYGGVTRSTQFVVRVVSELDRLAVDHRQLPSFHPDTYSYDVIVPADVPTPRISASSPDPTATVQVRQDPADEQVSGGPLTITPEQGDLSGANPPARNVLLQPALGNWAMVSKLTFNTAPHVANQQGGIIAHQDDANWLKLDWEYSGGAAQLAETTSDNQNITGQQITQVLDTVPTAGVVNSGTVWLAMDKVGSRYTTYYSTDDAHFTPIYRVGASLSNVKVGLVAWNGPATTSDLQVSYQHFQIINQAPADPRPTPRR